MKLIIKKLLNNRHIQFFLLSIFLSLPILIYKDIPISHDILFHLSRLKGISYEMSIGSFPIFIYHNFINNLGYASPLFYSDLFLYPFAILYKFLPLTIVYKILIISINLATIYTIHFFLLKMLKNKFFLSISMIAYLFSSYRFIDLYIRGNIGESLTFIFLPLVILGLEEIVYGDKSKYYYLIIGMSGIIYSHVISTFLVGIFVFFFILFNMKKLISSKRYLVLLKAIFITFFITSSFLLPFLEQLIDRNFYIYNLCDSPFTNINVPIYKLFLAFPMPSKEWLPIGIGSIYLLIIIFSIKYRKKLEYRDMIYLFLGMIFLFCASDLLPKIIYQKIFFIIQFQWRFYLLATMCLYALFIRLICYISNFEWKILKIILYVSIVVILTTSITNNFIYDKVYDFDNEYLGFYEYLPKGISYSDIDNKVVKANLKYPIKYEINYNKGKMFIKYAINEKKDNILIMPLLYYKGYSVNKNYTIINNNGLVAIKLKPGSDELIVTYKGTLLARSSFYISLLSFIFFIIMFYHKKDYN